MAHYLNTRLAAKDSLKLNKCNKHLFNKPEHYFILFLTTNYL